ncbi:outer membrane protein [Bartonella sp. B10]
MNIKYLMMTSFISLISASVVHAADVMAPREAASPVVTAPAIDVSALSLAGFYVGGQVGNFSSKVTAKDPAVLSKDKTPRPSGFMGGVYGGFNVELGSNFVFGVETDAVWAGREDKKIDSSRSLAAGDDVRDWNAQVRRAGITLAKADEFAEGDILSKEFAYKERWSGATRARVGFAVINSFMPYVSGGVAYAQMQGSYLSLGKKKEGNSKPVSVKESDDRATMVGYTVGGGVDFAMTDNILLRAEYRYSDFGKKKFKKYPVEFQYRTNDVRVGVAYKF